MLISEVEHVGCVLELDSIPFDSTFFAAAGRLISVLISQDANPNGTI